MRVGIDARFITKKPRRGIGNYSLNLVRELVNLDDSIDYTLYVAQQDVENSLPILPNVTVKVLRPSIYPIWENISLPLAAKRDKLDILHSLGNTAPILLDSKIYQILTLHDVMFLQQCEFIPKPTTMYQRFGRIYRKLIVPLAARKAHKIITSSQHTQKDIFKLIPQINKNKTRVLYIPCDSIFSDFATDMKIGDYEMIESKSPFILCLGAQDPRKNTLRTIKAYLNLLTTSQITENLIIVGYRNWEASKSYQLVKESSAQERVFFLDYVSIEQLAILYRKATAFIYPSIYEGFGIPPLEALSSGCPVLASKSSSIPEVCGNAALYFDPLNEEEITNCIALIVRDIQLRNRLKTLGHQRAKLFSWNETALQIIKMYHECLKRR